MSKFLTPTRLVLALGGLAATSATVNAAAFTIDDTSPNETLTYSMNDWEGGFSLNGVLVQQGLNNPASLTFPETDTPDSFTGTWITNGAQGQVSGSVYLVESLVYDPATPALLSDIFTYQVVPNSDGTATISGTFVSSDNLGYLDPATVDPSSVYPEDGTPVVVNFAFLSIEIRSDQVPAPAPIAAMLGLGGMVLTRRRRA